MNTAATAKKTYFRVWVALLALLLLTWGLAEVDLGPFNNVVALGIAIAKMMLVVLFFMHARDEKPIMWLFIAAGVIWFLIMMDLTLSDYLTRPASSAFGQSWQPGTPKPLPH